MPGAPKCLSCGSYLGARWGKTPEGGKRPRAEWQCPYHGTVLQCARHCPGCVTARAGVLNGVGRQAEALVLHQLLLLLLRLLLLLLLLLPLLPRPTLCPLTPQQPMRLPPLRGVLS